MWERENTHQNWKMNSEGSLTTDAVIGRVCLFDKDDRGALIVNFS